ncbi:3-phosphoinositide-dependent protein kinase B-like [Canna indica]|uniref:3-phosphoinositide-dependent protein kinase B-like n=1 Tax=Canna indica TaxID=4628 RepID=A0AAQ3K426_9LILI|nr:3-phosphoinositide-dependent protein kinase B-like [Canna indica]
MLEITQDIVVQTAKDICLLETSTLRLTLIVCVFAFVGTDQHKIFMVIQQLELLVSMQLSYLIVDACDFGSARNIIQLITMGAALGIESQVIQGPFKTDLASPPTSTKSRAFGCNIANQPRISFVNKHGSDSQQPLQVAIASKITNLVNVTALLRPSKISSDHKENGASSGASTPRGEVRPCASASPTVIVEEKSLEKEKKLNNDEDEG